MTLSPLILKWYFQLGINTYNIICKNMKKENNSSRYEEWHHNKTLQINLYTTQKIANNKTKLGTLLNNVKEESEAWSEVYQIKCDDISYGQRRNV